MSTPAVQVPISAVDLTGPAFTSARANAEAFHSAIESTNTSFIKARGAAVLLNEEVGLKMSRGLAKAAVECAPLRAALEMAFPVVAVIGFAEVLGRLPAILERAFDFVSGLDAENKLIEGNARVEESLHKIAEATALAQAAYDRLGKSAEQVELMNKAQAAAKLVSSQSLLSSLKAQLVANEALAKQTYHDPGNLFVGGPTEQALAAKELIPALSQQVRILSEQMKGFEIASNGAGKKMDEAFTTAADKAAKFAEAGKKAQIAWGWMADRKRTGTGGKGGALDALESAPGQSMLDNERFFDPTATPSWMSQLSNQQGSLYSGTSQGLELVKIQTDQNEALKEASTLYDDARTKLQKFNDEMNKLVAVSNATHMSQEQFRADAAKIGETLDKSSKAYAQLGNEIGKTLMSSELFSKKWSEALKKVLDDIVKLILQMYVFKTLADSMGGKNGGFFGQLFAGMAGLSGKASGGPVSSGMSYIVGEQGPELFTPGSSGAITPNGAMGGTTNHYYDQRGAIVTDDLVRKGQLASAMRFTESRSIARSVAATAQLAARR